MHLIKETLFIYLFIADDFLDMNVVLHRDQFCYELQGL